jgi:hypothetical protein
VTTRQKWVTAGICLVAAFGAFVAGSLVWPWLFPSKPAMDVDANGDGPATRLLKANDRERAIDDLLMHRLMELLGKRFRSSAEQYEAHTIAQELTNKYGDFLGDAVNKDLGVFVPKKDSK